MKGICSWLLCIEDVCDLTRNQYAHAALGCVGCCEDYDLPETQYMPYSALAI